MKKKIKTLIFLLTISMSSFAQSLTDTIQLKEISVTGSHTASKETPFTVQNLTSKDINLRGIGTEPATILASTPSVTFYSDNGSGTGYNYYRLRGIDQTRINSTLNGVPLNEPEDQGIYYNNFGGFLNAISGIQIIRGAGLSKPGVSSYGGSIDFTSLEFAKKWGGTAQVTGGSFNTLQINGLVNSPNFFLQFNKSYTDGYKERSQNSTNSAFYGGKLVKGNNEFKFYGFVGEQENGMAWMGESLDSIKKNPRYNSNTDKEIDHFLEVHNQINWKNGIVQATIYHTYLNGWYTTDMGHFDPSHPIGDLINKLALKSNWFGTNLNIQPKIGFLYTNFGLSAYTYTRDHEGSYNKYNSAEPWYYSYNNSGTKNELSPYAKAEIKLGKFAIYGDAQYRYSSFSYSGLLPFETLKYKFFNWSAGVSLSTGNKSSAYYGIGLTHREPSRSDLFAGIDDLDTSMVVNILPEQALNNELGWKYKDGDIAFSANLYYMDFKNEIVLNGKVGPNSLLLHQNAAKSFRSGLEIDAQWDINPLWTLSTTNSFSYNRIKQNGETFQPVLTPSIMLSGDIMFNVSRSVYTGLNISYIGKSYIDFSNEHQLPSNASANIYAGVNWKQFSLRAEVDNLANEVNLVSAVMSGPDPRYFVQSRRSGILSLTYKF
jgi:iron complex outermembrane recepter protein